VKSLTSLRVSVKRVSVGAKHADRNKIDRNPQACSPSS
jgi:hypothetical protein